MVRAPVSGRVIDLSVAAGEFRNDPNSVLMTIADLSTVWVTANVPEKDLRRVKVGDAGVAVLVAYPGEEFRGKVLCVGDLLDVDTTAQVITMVFRDGVEDYGVRQRVQERLRGVELPPGATPVLDPLFSPVGEIYRYTLESPQRDQREIRELQNWVVVPAFKQIPGVADVTTFGGETTQFQVLLDPSRLVEFKISLRQVLEAIQANNANSGGSILVRGDQAFVVRGIGLMRSLTDLGNVVVTQKSGVPVLLRHLGGLKLGALERRGILGKDANPDGVSGIVLLLRGMNPSEVLRALHGKVAALNGGLLPPDTKIVPYLDRTELVDTTIRIVARTVAEGIVLVVLVLLLFFGCIRAALIVAATIPFSLLVAFLLMKLTGVPANLLSLGAIDFGIIVNGAIVVVESVLRRREERAGLPLTPGLAFATYRRAGSLRRNRAFSALQRGYARTLEIAGAHSELVLKVYADDLRGADVVLHSVTKFINGHADVVGGVLVAVNERIHRRLHEMMVLAGCNMDPHQAFLVRRGLKTLALRLERAQESAARIARWIEARDEVAWKRGRTS